MRDNRVSCIPIERPISSTDTHTTRTVGLSFLTDIMFLLRLPDFAKILDEPVIKFVTELNGLEEDYSAYFDIVGGEHGTISGGSIDINVSSAGIHHAHTHAHSAHHVHSH